MYYVVEGSVGEETVSLEGGDPIRLDPEESREIHNRGDERATLVVAGAPL